MNSRFQLLVLCFVTVLAKPPDYNFHLHKSDGNESDENSEERDFDGGTNVGRRRFDEDFNFSAFESEEETDSELDSKYMSHIQGDSNYGSEKEANRTRSDPKNDKHKSDPKAESATQNLLRKTPVAFPSDETTKSTTPKTPWHSGQSGDARKSESDEKFGRHQQWKSNSRNQFVNSPEVLKDVETIFPQDKVLLLPLVNGKPRPYDGYRAAPEFESHRAEETKDSTETAEERERRLNEGEVIYGKPKVAIGPSRGSGNRWQLENPKEPKSYYEFSDSKLTETNADSGKTLKKSSMTTRNGKIEFSDHGSYRNSKRVSSGKNEDEHDPSFSLSKSYQISSERKATNRGRSEPQYTYEKVDYFYENQKGDPLAKERRAKYYEDGENANEKEEDGKLQLKKMPSNRENFFVSSDASSKYSVATKKSDGNKWGMKNESVRSKARESSAENSRRNAKTESKNSAFDSKTKEKFKTCSSRLKSRNPFFQQLKFKRNETSNSNQRRYRRSANTQCAYKEGETTEGSKCREKRESSDAEYFQMRKANSGSGFLERSEVNGNGEKTYRRWARASGTSLFDGNDKISRLSSLRRESANVYGGPTSVYDSSGETYGVPASIYKDLFESEEESDDESHGRSSSSEYHDGTFGRYEEEESPEYHRNSSTSSHNYYNQYNRREAEYGNKYFPGSRETLSEYAKYSRGRQRPKKFADRDGSSFDQDNQQRQTAVSESKRASETEEETQRKFFASGFHPKAATSTKEGGESKFQLFENKKICRSEKKGEFICRVCEYGKGSTTHIKCRHGGNSKDKYYAFESQKTSSSNRVAIKELEKNSDGRSKTSDETGKKTSSIGNGDKTKKKFSVAARFFNNAEKTTKPFDFVTARKRGRRQAKEDFGEYAYDDDEGGDSEEKTGRQENKSSESNFKDFDDDFDDAERSGSSSSSVDDDFDSFENDESESKKFYTFDPFSKEKKYGSYGKSSEEEKEWKRGEATTAKPERYPTKNSGSFSYHRQRDGTKMAEESKTKENGKNGPKYENFSRNGAKSRFSPSPEEPKSKKPPEKEFRSPAQIGRRGEPEKKKNFGRFPTTRTSPSPFKRDYGRARK